MRGGPLLVTLLVGAQNPAVHAQSVDACMRAAPAEAVSVCRALVDDGRADADVWTQLALSLSKTGDAEGAERAIADGLRRHPSDGDLLALRERLATDRSEADLLERAGRRNASAVALGELKLVCRTRTGQNGIEACRRYLSRTDADGERIRERLAVLEQASIPTPASEPPPSAEPPTPDSGVSAETRIARADATGPDPTNERRDTRPADTAPDADPAALARRDRVASIQRALGALGLPVGAADGIAGRRTREALRRFELLSGLALGTDLDQRTLDALERERVRLADARDTLAASRRALAAGRPEEAREVLARAETASALLAVPSSYRDELDAAEAENARRERLATSSSAPVDASASAPDNALTDLMQRIDALERQLADARERARRDAGRLRTEVSRTLAR